MGNRFRYLHPDSASIWSHEIANEPKEKVGGSDGLYDGNRVSYLIRI